MFADTFTWSNLPLVEKLLTPLQSDMPTPSETLRVSLSPTITSGNIFESDSLGFVNMFDIRFKSRFVTHQTKKSKVLFPCLRNTVL